MWNSSFFTITNRVIAGLTHVERARGFLDAAAISVNWIREMDNRIRALKPYHKSYI